MDLLAEEATKGFNELLTFAKKTLDAVIMSEERRMSGVEYSQLRILANIDISVMWLEMEERYEYYVEEIGDGAMEALFHDYVEPAVSVFRTELASALGKMVLLRRMHSTRLT